MKYNNPSIIKRHLDPGALQKFSCDWEKQEQHGSYGAVSYTHLAPASPCQSCTPVGCRAPFPAVPAQQKSQRSLSSRPFQSVKIPRGAAPARPRPFPGSRWSGTAKR